MMVVHNDEMAEWRSNLLYPLCHFRFCGFRFPEVKAFKTMTEQDIDQSSLPLKKLRLCDDKDLQCCVLCMSGLAKQVERCVPIFPHWLTTQFLKATVDFLRRTFVAHRELL